MKPSQSTMRCVSASSGAGPGVRHSPVGRLEVRVNLVELAGVLGAKLLKVRFRVQREHFKRV